MMRTMLKSKIHRATVTQADLHYVGSVTIDEDLLDAADLLPGEQVAIVDVTNGARLETYVIPGERGSGVIGINGAAAHLVHPGDLVILISYGVMDETEAKSLIPKVVHVDAANRVVELGADPSAPVPGAHRRARPPAGGRPCRNHPPPRQRPRRSGRDPAMMRTTLKSKIHRATVTQADLHYVGSVTVDEDLLDAADLIPGEQVAIVDVTNGARLETYVIPGERGSGVIGINGAAAHLVHPGDLVILISYGLMDESEAKSYIPRVVHVDGDNRVVELGGDPSAPVPGAVDQARSAFGVPVR